LISWKSLFSLQNPQYQFLYSILFFLFLFLFPSVTVFRITLKSLSVVSTKSLFLRALIRIHTIILVDYNCTRGTTNLFLNFFFVLIIFHFPFTVSSRCMQRKPMHCSVQPDKPSISGNFLN
jgi:hypothetical protein